jgi:hypothetical protein
MGIKVKQAPNIPAIKHCSECGSEAHLVDWYFRGMWAVMCDYCHNSNSECISKHRAVSRWNRKQEMEMT